MKEESGKKRSFFERLMRFLNILTILALLCAYAGGSISPATFWPLAFAAMAYPLILLGMTFFILYWLMKRKWFLFLNLALLLIKPDLIYGTFGAFGSSESDSPSIRVMTYNVRLFDKYNWNSEANSRDKIISLLNEHDADIICIQEYYDVNQQVLKQLSKNGERNIHLRNYFAQRNNKNDFGIATITKFPIVNEGPIVLENSRSALAIYTDLKINNDTVRVFNFHLQSIHLGADGYAILDDLMEGQELEELTDSKLLAGRLKSGFSRRAEQAEKIAHYISNSSYPVLVCGAFNDVPSSYPYQTISEGLHDSFAESGKGIGATYVRVPFFRIDNILFSPEFEASDHTTFDSRPYSDHYAVSTRLSVRD